MRFFRSHRGSPPLRWLLGAALLTAGCKDAESGLTSAAAPSGERQWQAAYASEVVSFLPGEGAGFGADRMPDVVLGSPEGGGASAGSLDVLSLGRGGEVVLRMGREIIDGPGPDFIVFENAFRIAGSTTLYQELGEVAVSTDGVSWSAFPCDPPSGVVDMCAGRTPVLATSSAGVPGSDPAASGGDAFDLANVALARARYVRIRDARFGGPGPTDGFDLDAVAALHGDTP